MTVLDRLKGTILIETANITRENLPQALEIVKSCWKSSSILWMQANGFPVLSGLVLSGWSRGSEEAVNRFCQERSVSELLVRIEKPGQRWTRRRGGYTTPLQEVRRLVEELTHEEMLTILLEPASPYADLFSLTSICDVDAGRIDLEVVGPGFDASDTLRADITPHERFEVSLRSKRGQSGSCNDFQIKQLFVVDGEGYRRSVHRRLVKIGARLRDPSYPDEVMNASATTSSEERLADEAIHYLRKSGQSALLEHLDQYERIAAGLLGMFLKEMIRLIRIISASKVDWKTFSLAGSFLPANRLVIWDFFPPGDHDTTGLVDLQAAATGG